MSVLQHEIVTEDTPICQKFRRMSPQMREEMHVPLHDMLQKDVISPSESPSSFLLTNSFGQEKR